MSNLTATPPTVAFGDLEQGKGHHFAMVMQLHSPNAADAVELRTHCTDPRLSVEAVRYKQGAVRVSVLCSSAGLVQGTIVCTAPGGSIRVPISARVLEPSQYKALHDSTPARMQTKPSGFVETLEADDEPPSATADVHRRPVVHVRALRFDDGVTAPQRRRPAATVPLVWTETDPALRTDPGPGPSVSPREHRAVDRMQVSEGAVHQAREAREVAGAQHSLARLVQHLNGLKGALARAEQKGQVPAAVAAQLQGLQGEMERLDPLIADAESFFNRQQSAGLRRAAAMQKAQLAPATIEEASRSEKHALQSLAKEQAKVLALEAKLAEAAEREKKAEARSVQQQARMAGLEQSLERAKAHGLKMSAAAEEAKARLAPVQKECEGMRAQIRRIAEKAEEENKGQHEVAALKSQLKAEQEEVEKLRKTTVPKVEAESAQKTAAYYKEQMEQAKEEALALRQQQTDLAGAAKLDHEWRASALQLLERITKWSKRADVASKLPDPAEHFKASGDPFMARTTEDWLGTLATMVAEAERTRGMAEVLPRGGKPQGGGQIAGMYAQLDEGRKTHRAKLIAARGMMATAKIFEAHLKMLAEPWSAWRRVVKMAADERAREAKLQADEAIEAARLQAEEVARESRASLQQQIDATKTQAQRRDEAEERASLAEAALKRAGEKQAEAERALAQATQEQQEKGEEEREAAQLASQELAELRGELQRAHEGHDLAEQRARQLKTQLRAESARAAELDRLLQTYGRDAYKRLGFDPIANAAREQAEQQRHALVFTPSVPQAPNFAGAAAAHAAPPFAFQNPTKGGGVLTAGGGAVMPGFRYRLPPNLPGRPARAAPARPAASRPASASLSRPNRPESAGSARPASARMVR